MRNIQLLQELNKLHQEDPLIKEIMNACGSVLDDNDASILIFLQNQFFDTANESGIKRYENEAAISSRDGQSLEDRAFTVSAKWKSGGKLDIMQLKSVADSWKNGAVEIAFVDGKIQITFISVYGLPDDIKGLESALDEVKPAHLPIFYNIRYLLVRDINAATINELQTFTINQFAGVETV